MVAVIGGLAAFLGHCVRLALPLARLLPLALIVYGVALFDVRVGWIVAGGLLWVAFNRPTDRRKA